VGLSLEPSFRLKCLLGRPLLAEEDSSHLDVAPHQLKAYPLEGGR